MAQQCDRWGQVALGAAKQIVPQQDEDPNKKMPGDLRSMAQFFVWLLESSETRLQGRTRTSLLMAVSCDFCSLFLTLQTVKRCLKLLKLKASGHEEV